MPHSQKVIHAFLHSFGTHIWGFGDELSIAIRGEGYLIYIIRLVIEDKGVERVIRRRGDVEVLPEDLIEGLCLFFGYIMRDKYSVEF